MLLLTAAADHVEVQTYSASDIEVHASYMDNNAGTFTPGRSNVASITTATVTNAVTGSSSIQRNVKHLNIRNNHASAECLVAVRHLDNDSGNTAELIECNLLPGETLIFDALGKWTHYTSNGEPYPHIDRSATQAEMETATSVDRSVTPAIQHHHPGHPKCWLNCGVTANDLASYNITSLTDTGVGLVTVTIATDFSSANWTCQTTTERASTALTGSGANLRMDAVQFGGQAAGTVVLECHDLTAGTALLADPTNWNMLGMGDHA